MNEKMKIIYIDDEETNLLLFRINFNKNFQVLTGTNGEQGLDLLENNSDTRIVISDMKMPQMNGLEFIKIAKEKFPNKRYYILTGLDVTDDILKALNSGLIQNYFKKPFNLKIIEEEINSQVIIKIDIMDFK